MAITHNLATFNVNNKQYQFTEAGMKSVSSYIKELEAKRKEILDAGLDTAEDTCIPDVATIVSDIEAFGFDSYTGDNDKEYCNGWGVTDNYAADYPLLLKLGRDFVETAGE